MLRDLLRRIRPVSFESLSTDPPESTVPHLDRSTVDDGSLDEHQRQWRREGVVILPGAIPEELIEAYCKTREGRLPHTLGFPTSYAYLSIPQLRAIALHKRVAGVLEKLIGVKMAMHFDLTQWISTERNWHQDDYLNPPEINSWYAATWFALDDIHPDCGPFEYVPGSHRWPIVRGHLVRKYMSEEEARSPNWPKFSEKIVTEAYEGKLATSGLSPKYFLGKKGDVLIWHGRLLHRGSAPRQPQMIRKALIAHYTAVTKIAPTEHDLAYTKDGYPYILHKNVKPFAW